MALHIYIIPVYWYEGSDWTQWFLVRLTAAQTPDRTHTAPGVNKV